MYSCYFINFATYFGKNRTIAPDLKFIVFLGMSYVTFRAVQMVFEVRDGLIKELSFFNFWEFVLFFPAISTGPIDRYRRFQKYSKAT